MDRLINQGIVIVVMLMSIPVVAADYTDMLKGGSTYATDCGDWSGIDNPMSNEITRHGYSHDYDKSCGWNRRRIQSPDYHGLPEDIEFVWGPEQAHTGKIVEWVYVYPIGFAKTVLINDKMYTDNVSNICVRCGWVRVPYYSPLSDMDNTIDSVATNITVELIDETVFINTTFTIDAHRTGKKSKKSYSTANVTVDKQINGMQIWRKPSESVCATITNCSGRLYLLEVDVPRGITGVSITTDVGTYEKHSYYMSQKLSDRGLQYFELESQEFEEYEGLVPYGVNLFASREPITEVDVKLYTPFEVLGADVTVVRVAEEKHNPRDTPAMFFNVCLIAGILYFIIKGALK